MLPRIVIRRKKKHLKEVNIASIYIIHVSKTQTLDLDKCGNLEYHTKLLQNVELGMDVIWEGICIVYINTKP